MNNGRWRVEHQVLYAKRGLLRRRELSFRLDRLLYAEMSDNPIARLLGRVRVRLYCSARRRAFFSVWLPKVQAAALMNRIVTQGREDVYPQHMVGGKYAALLSSVTSRGTVLPLGAALMLCLFGFAAPPFQRAVMSALAAGLWLWAFLFAVARFLSECRMSVCIVNSGFVMQTGVLGGRRLFVPHASVTGVLERRNPAAAFCGASRFELICEGGKRIVCMRWYEGGCGEEAAKRLLQCEGIRCAEASADGLTVRRYAHRLVEVLLLAALAWAAVMRTGGEWRMVLTEALLLLLLPAAAHCLMAMVSGRAFGLSVTAGTLRVGGMGLLTAEFLTVKRGCMSSVRLRQGLWERANGRCSAVLFPKGSRRGVKGGCLPYERTMALFGA